MTIPENFEIITSRLSLIPISLDYKDDIFREFTEEVAKFLIPQPTGRIEDTVNFIDMSRRKTLAGQELQLIALDKDTKEFFGLVGLHNIDTKVPELGLWFKKSAWGVGYGKESMQALKGWADANLDYEKIRYPIIKGNTASQKIVESLGGKIAREMLSKNQRGEERQEVEYFINRY